MVTIQIQVLQIASLARYHRIAAIQRSGNTTKKSRFYRLVMIAQWEKE